jgi:hypothetical protein
MVLPRTSGKARLPEEGGAQAPPSTPRSAEGEGKPAQRTRKQGNAAKGGGPGPANERKKRLSKRMRDRDEQNKGTKQDAVRKRKGKKEDAQPAAP